MTARFHAIFVCSLAFGLILGACGAISISTETPIPTATLPPPTQPPPTEEAPTSIPTPIPVALAGPESGSKMTWLDGSTLVYVPAGQFQMGSGAPDAPVHPITLEEFWIYETKVTNRMFSQCVTAGSCTAPAQELGGPVYSNPDFANHPVIGVSWDQAQAYCTWAQGQLPTEAEWEKTARGTDNRVYPWGSEDPSCDLANFGSCLGHTNEVTAYSLGQSPYGALDLSGNVFEWTNDWYDEAYYSVSPPADPTGPESGQYRVVRGSSFESEDNQTLSSIRRFNEPTDHSRDTGFRCTISQPKPLAPSCQLSAYIPAGQVASGSCEPAVPEVLGQFCSGDYGRRTIDLPEGATWEALDESFDCSEGIVDGERRLTCIGPRAREVTGDVTVCNSSCSNSPDITGATPVCDPGYSFDSGTGACQYAPITDQAEAAGCPVGYVIVERGGQQACALGPGANGLCAPGLYYDSLYGACVPPAGQAEAPYGIDDPALAAQTFQGCAPGYAYDESTQCCQASASDGYPGCSPGFTLNTELGVCTPGDVQASAPGCTTLSVTIPACGRPEDVCKRIKSETHCIQNSYACRWNEDEGICVLK